MPTKPFAALSICASITMLTLWVEKSYFLGDNNFIFLTTLLMGHTILTGAALRITSGQKLFNISIIALLIIGQWWAIEFITMLIIWHLRGFST